MYVDVSTVRTKGRSYTRYLLRESYREGRKVQHRTIANLSSCSQEEIEAIRLALKHKKDLAQLGSLQQVRLKQGRSVGAVWLLWRKAKDVGLSAALGSTRAGKLALWQVMARVIHPGSRLAAVRLAERHAACEVLGLEGFTEDDLYKNLDWLEENQGNIEQKLLEKRRRTPPRLYLYDVTSSYLEGANNELGAFGYNRDRKRGKRQILIGLLCDEQGLPVSVEVFTGNLKDPETLLNQIQKIAQRFSGQEVVLVGDRGMIKSPQIEQIQQAGFHYITAITKPQINKLLKDEVLQMGLFDEQVSEVISSQGLRYLVRCNPVRRQEVAANRASKLKHMQDLVENKNRYLQHHPRATVEVALRDLQRQLEKLKLNRWSNLVAEGRHIHLPLDEPARQEEAKLDGCYVLVTDLSEKIVDKHTIHDRYRDLAKVERAFRSSKTEYLEIRPVHVRKATRTRGHVFVVMLAYLLIRELAQDWADLEITVEEGIRELSELCATEVIIEGQPRCQSIPQPRRLGRSLLKASGVELPTAILLRKAPVATRKKLASRRLKAD
jgi:transposase